MKQSDRLSELAKNLQQGHQTGREWAEALRARERHSPRGLTPFQRHAWRFALGLPDSAPVDAPAEVKA